MVKRLVAVVFALLLVTLLVGCGGGTSSMALFLDRPQDFQALSMGRGIEVYRPTYLTTNCLLEAVITGDDGEPIVIGEVTFTSSNPDAVLHRVNSRIVSVRVNSIFSGRTTITATYTDGVTTLTKQEVFALAKSVIFDPASTGVNLNSGTLVGKSDSSCDFTVQPFYNELGEFDHIIMGFPHGGQAIECPNPEEPIDIFATNYTAAPDNLVSSFETTNVDRSLTSYFYFAKDSQGNTYKVTLVTVGEHYAEIIYFLEG